MTKQALKERDEALTTLREWIKPGDTVYTILRHVSRSGMQREIGIVLLGDDERPARHPNYMIAKALGMRQGKGDALIVGGCGMDMGFHVVHNLGYALYPEGFECIGDGDGRKRCPSNDHANGDRNYAPHHHTSGGYALRQEWL